MDEENTLTYSLALRSPRTQLTVAKLAAHLRLPRAHPRLSAGLHQVPPGAPSLRNARVSTQRRRVRRICALRAASPSRGRFDTVDTVASPSGRWTTRDGKGSKGIGGGAHGMSGRRLREAAERGDSSGVKAELESGAQVNDSVRKSASLFRRLPSALSPRSSRRHARAGRSWAVGLWAYRATR